MYTFRDFSGRNIGAAEREVRPTNLQQLRRAILAAETEGLPIHAMGSRWAFSAPAYCSGVVVETAELDGFPQRSKLRSGHSQAGSSRPSTRG